MQKLTTTAPRVWASYNDEYFVSGSEICLPDTADVTEWLEFESVEAAKAHFNVSDLSNSEMLMGLGI